jgi:hypothetical protein
VSDDSSELSDCKLQLHNQIEQWEKILAKISPKDDIQEG